MKDTLILDGGMGQELVARSTRPVTPLWATQILLEEPELVEAVHTAYFAAGADIATTNSYTSHRDRLRSMDAEAHFETVLIQAGEIANRARDKHGKGLIAGSLGPNTKSYRPDLVLPIEQGAEIYAEIAGILTPFVDVMLLETMVSIQQIQGAVQGAQTSDKPVWVSVSVDDNDGQRLRSGELISDAVVAVKALGVDTLLINCARPEAVTQALSTIAGSGLKLGAYANGFTEINESFKQVDSTVDALKTRTDLDPDAYLAFAKDWHQLGTHIIGGCCEVGPAHIEQLAKHFKR